MSNHSNYISFRFLFINVSIVLVVDPEKYYIPISVDAGYVEHEENFIVRCANGALGCRRPNEFAFCERCPADHFSLDDPVKYTSKVNFRNSISTLIN